MTESIVIAIVKFISLVNQWKRGGNNNIWWLILNAINIFVKIGSICENDMLCLRANFVVFGVIHNGGFDGSCELIVMAYRLSSLEWYMSIQNPIYRLLIKSTDFLPFFQYKTCSSSSLFLKFSVPIIIIITITHQKRKLMHVSCKTKRFFVLSPLSDDDMGPVDPSAAIASINCM